MDLQTIGNTISRIRYALKSIDKDVLEGKQDIKELTKRIGKIEERLLKLEVKSENH